MKILNETSIHGFNHTLRDDGIVEIHVTAESVHTLKCVLESYEMVGKMVNYKKVPILLTFDIYSMPSIDVRLHWKKEDAAPYSLAEAYVVSSLGHKMIGHLHSIIDPPPRPTQMFTNREKAIKWLKTFL